MSNNNMINKNKIKFTVKGEDGKDINLAVVRPSRKVVEAANIESGRKFNEAASNKFMLAAKIDDYLREQNLWNDDKEKLRQELDEKLVNGRKRLASGGFKLSEARKLALDMMKWRQDLRDLLSVRTDLESRTAEGQAENAKLNYLIYACTVYNDSGEKYYKSLDHYYEDAGSEVGSQAAIHLMSLLSGLDLGLDDKSPELQFLRKNKLVDDKDRLIDGKGRLIDINGKLINEDGHYIDEEGNLIDIYGNKVDADGNLLTDFVPFIDDISESKVELAETKTQSESEPANNSDEPVVASSTEIAN